MAVDVDSDMPVAAVVASANGRTRRSTLRGSLIRRQRWVKGVKHVVADSQYSSENVRGLIEEHSAEPIISYMSNKKRGEEVLRVDRVFRVSGPAEERKIYGLGRAAVERVNSRLDFVGLECLKIKGLRNIMVHVVLCVISMLLVDVAIIRLGRLWKARSLSSFWW